MVEPASQSVFPTSSEFKIREVDFKERPAARARAATAQTPVSTARLSWSAHRFHRELDRPRLQRDLPPQQYGYANVSAPVEHVG